jgi:hypothetical protein
MQSKSNLRKLEIVKESTDQIPQQNSARYEARPIIRSFRDHLENQPERKLELLYGSFTTGTIDTHYENTSSKNTLSVCCVQTEEQREHTGSYGWVIATDDKPLWECVGTATGWFTNSFKSEGIGQLALLVFLEAFVEYYELKDIPPPSTDRTEPWFRIATDNQGMIAHIKQSLATQTKFAGAGFSPEYDGVNETVKITRCLPFPLTWEHVKGHQGDRKKWYELTWMETLNVRADKNATIGPNAALEVMTSPARMIRIIPSSKVGLRIHGTDITSHYATRLPESRH